MDKTLNILSNYVKQIIDSDYELIKENLRLKKRERGVKASVEREWHTITERRGLNKPLLFFAYLCGALGTRFGAPKQDSEYLYFKISTDLVNHTSDHIMEHSTKKRLPTIAGSLVHH